jgi:uncharacterized protein YjbI with pentapeptide repeats
VEIDSSPVRAVAEGPASVATRLFRYRRLPRVAVIAKLTLDLVPESEAVLAAEPEPLFARARSVSPLLPSSIDRPAELAPFIPHASVLLVGHARAPGGRPVPSLVTRLVVLRGAALIDRRVVVLGECAPGGSAPEPFDAMPLVWERAFGGPFCAANPVGRGADASDPRAPNLLDPSNALLPAAFAPIPAHWAARRGLLQGVVPGSEGPLLDLPDAFDFRYFAPAPPELQCADLLGGDWLIAEGVDAEHSVLRTRLPHLRVLARLEDPSGRPHAGVSPFALVADTLLVDADTRRATLTFRGNIVLPEVVAYADLIARVVVDGGEGEVRWRSDEGAAAPVSDALATEPPPPGGPTEGTTEDTKKLAVEAADALRRSLAPFPVATPRSAADPGAPIPGAPWAPAESPVPPEPSVAGEPAPPAPPVEDPGFPGYFDDVARARHLAEHAPPEPVREGPLPAAPLSLREPAKPPTPPATGLRAEVLAAIEARQSLAGKDLAGAELDDIDFGGLSLAKANLRKAQLRGARLAECDLEGADLGGAELSGASLASARLVRADLAKAKLAGACLDGAQLVDANLLGAEGPGATFRDARAQRAHLTRGLWDGAVFDGAELSGADFTAASVQAGSFRGAVLVEARFDEARASRADFTGVRADKLRAVGASFDQGTFARAELVGATLEKSSFADASFFQAKLRGAGLVGARCTGADFSAADLGEARLRQADVGGARFDEASLRAAKLQRVTGLRARFVAADLEGADLRHASLPAADFASAQLRKAWMDNAELPKARFARADLRKASLRAAKLAGASFAHANLEGADLRDADLTGANFREARRDGAKTSGAKLDDLVDEDAERFDLEVRGKGPGGMGER